MYEDSTELATPCGLYGVRELFVGDCASSWSSFFHKRQILHVEESNVEHIKDDHCRAPRLNNLQHAHVHRFAPHRFDERQDNVTAIEHGNRQHVQNRQVHI